MPVMVEVMYGEKHMEQKFLALRMQMSYDWDDKWYCEEDTVVALVSQLKVAMEPESEVWYCRQSCWGAIKFPHTYCVTFICHDLVVVVVPVSMSMLMELQLEEAGTKMC